METKIIIAGPEHWQEYKTIRLKALKADPIAFGVTYEQDVLLSEEEWKERLFNPFSQTYLAMANDNPVALATVRREKAKNVEHLATINSVFTDPEFRQHGISSKILKNILDDLHANDKTVKVRLSVNVAQESARKMYEKSGFFKVAILPKEMKVNEKYYDQIEMAYIFKDKL